MRYFIIALFTAFASLAFALDSGISNRIVYASTPVTTASWVEVIHSLTNPVGRITVFDSSGQTLQLGLGTSGNEVQMLIIPPGGGDFPLTISAGSRVSIRAVSASATSGENDINFFFR